MRLSKEILKEYQRYAVIFESGSQDKRDVYVRIFYNNLEKLISCSMSFAELSAYVEELIRVVHDHYGAAPILLIDEYDQPVLSSYENGYRKELGDVNVNIKMIKKWKIKMYIFQDLFLSLCFHKGSFFF